MKAKICRRARDQEEWAASAIGCDKRDALARHCRSVSRSARSWNTRDSIRISWIWSSRACSAEREFRWYREGKLKLNDLVTHRYSNTAVDDLEHGRILGRGIFTYAW